MSTVTPRTTRTPDDSSKRWSAPPRSNKTMGRAARAPEQVLRDVRGLKMRRRVSLALGDDILRGELEDMISAHSQYATTPSAFRTYQDFLIPSGSLNDAGSIPGLSSSVISDIRGADTLHYTKKDRQLRCKLASVYRLMQMFGWANGIYDRASYSVCATGDDNEEKRYFIAPTGLLFGEVTASSILKVDHKGNIVEQGNTNLGVSKTVFDLHVTIHSARKDAKCVLFLTADSVNVVSAIKQGLVPISQEGVAVGEVSYHDYPGISLDEDAKESLINSFGSSSRVLVLRNYGAICVGETIEETTYLAHLLVTACNQQAIAMKAGMDELRIIDDDVKEQMMSAFNGGLDANENQHKLAELNFEAWMRQLDAKGCKTGYNYRNADIFKKPEEKESKARETAPPKAYNARTDFAFYWKTDGHPVRRTQSLGRGNTYRSRLKWLNAPVKATEYKMERELDNSEPVLIKDMKPENEDKDEEVFITTKVVSVNESAPEPEVTEEVVTFVQAEKRHFEPQDIQFILDDSQGDLDANVRLVREPVGVVRRKSGNKVKKRRSFREKFKRLSVG
ncbi:alpha-adducin-like [Porites lutea]|uniref:alpha-adducin-like n=1 Tax=Porites lutea TaxID=51062 RepID=UPI003CC69983